MKESIINYLKEHGKSSVNDIAQALNHAGGEKFPQLIKAISAMESKGQLRFNRDGSVSLRPKKENPNQVTVEGVFRANKNGFGFLHVDDSEDDMFIGRNDVGHAIDGDTVAVVIKKPADRLRGTAAEARVVEIVERSLKTVVGKFILSDEKEPYAGYIKSKNQKIQQPIYIKKEPVALDGTEIIKVDIEKYPNRHYDYFVGSVRDIIGHQGDAGKGTKIRIGENVVSYQTGEQEEAPIQEMNTVRVPRGSEYRLILSDGTKVWLNAESQLIYPVRFTGENREVIMKGEACFEVAKKEKQPFVVKVDEIEVLVTGTLFNVEAYPETKEVKMTLVEGRVEVKTEEHRQLLSPDEQALVDKQEGQIRVRKVVAEEYIGWTRGEFRFTRTRLEEVMTRLARWYDVEVFFAVPDLKNTRFTLNLERYDNINKILSKIEKTGRVHFRIQGQCIIVE